MTLTLRESFLALAEENTSVCPTSCVSIETLKSLSLPWCSISNPYLEKLLPGRQFFLDFIYLAPPRYAIYIIE